MPASLKTSGGKNLKVNTTRNLVRYSSAPSGSPGYVSPGAVFPDSALYPDTTLYPSA